MNYDAYLALYKRMKLISVPLIAGTKKPIHKKWPETQFSDVDRLFADSPGSNIGILLGVPSGNIVDVDLDNDFALDFGPRVLPATGFTFGRRSTPQSHYFYRVEHPAGGLQFVNPHSGKMIVELRADRQFTVVPGSVHDETGEHIEFVGEPDDPSHDDWDNLHGLCGLIAVGSVLSGAWKKGHRHYLAVAAAGYLAACGVSRQDAVRVISGVVAWEGDEEADDRLAAVRTTYNRVAAGEPVKGRAALAELLDPKVMVAISKWLGRGPSASESKRHNDPSSVNGGSAVFEAMGTDLGAATAFAAAVEGKLIYADDTQRWLRKEMGVFEPVTGENVVGVAVDFVRHLNQNATRGFERDHIKKLESSGRIRSMVDLAKPQLRRSQSSFDRDTMLAGCRNGVLDLRARCLVETDDVITKRLGAAFDPEAECADFEKFMSEVFDADEEVIRFVQRAVGYTLTGTTSAQCLFVCIGSGSNGKSTFSGILHALMGDYAATVPMHTLMQSRYGGEKTDDLAILKTIRYASAQEGEAGSQLAEAKIKIMTGGDPITCRQLYKNYETYIPQFKLWLSTNDLPQVRGTGEAIWRRINVIPFPVTFSNDRKDPGLKEKLTKELPGILNWALEGLRMFDLEGLNPPSAIQKATGDYRGESDTVHQFVNDCCNRFIGSKTPMLALYDAYKDWCSSSGVEPLSNVSLGKELTRLGFESYRSKNGNGRKDLILKD